MSSSDNRRAGPRRATAAISIALVVSASLLAGCTVRPLYGEPSGFGPAATAQARLASVDVKPVSDRVGIETRNHLIFLMTGGASRTLDPRYALTLDVDSTAIAAAVVQAGALDNEPTAGTMRVSGRYLLRDLTSGEVVASGNRSVMSAYDRPRQLFAVARAERDAENRAARELAEQLFLSVAQDMERLPSG